MNLSGRRIIVTGGAGFIGSHLVDGLLDREPAHVVVVDNLWLGSEANLESARTRRKNLAFYKENAEDYDALRAILATERIDLVFNLATKPLPYSFQDPEGAFQVNVDLARTLARLLREGAYERLVQFSSSEVYGTARDQPMTEEHPYHPTTPYAAGKLAADLLLESFAAIFPLKVLTIRPFNNYGPRQNKGAYAGVIPITIRRILDGAKPMLEGDGEQTRDFLFVGDTVRLTLALCQQDAAWGGTFNLASGKETRIAEVVRTIGAAMGYGGEIERRPVRPGDHRRHVGGTAKARALVSFDPLTALEAGIAETVAWYRGRSPGS